MKQTFAQAISATIREEMRRDDKIIVYGEDVAEIRGMVEEGPRVIEVCAAGRED